MRIQVEHIGVERSGKKILDNVCFAVEDGEFVSVLGESGAGKSSALKVIAGLMVQDAGEVLFDGQCVDDVPSHKRSTAIVFQDIRLFPNMNVRENVAFSLRMQGMSKAERGKIADEVLAAVQLEGYGDRRTKQLSGGQQQRVALARALAGRPRALLLDEPFSGLDEQLRGDMRALVSRLHEQFGMTSIMVTHDPDEALTMSDRIVCMSEGRVLQSGTPGELLTKPADSTVAGIFGHASALSGTVSDGVFSVGKLLLPVADVADGRAVLVRLDDGGRFVHALDDSKAGA